MKSYAFLCLALAAASFAPGAESVAPPLAPSAAAPASADAKGGPPAAATASATDKYADLNKKFVRDWTVEELYRKGNLALNAGGRDFERAEKVWEALSCTTCHHFNGGVGGIGPDLTGAGAKFGVEQMLREILEPSDEISTIYSTVAVYTEDGKRTIGRPMGQSGDAYTLALSWGIDPQTGTAAWNGPIRAIPNATITAIEESGISPMPPGQLSNLTEEEIFDFLAYIISGGNRKDRMFQPQRPAVGRGGAGNPTGP